ncbi:FtsX-like permease family protein [Frankia sp. Hr75.2]|nr:FtsX-like permease family protein [Frankia sp. Hr75.2]
MIRLGLRLAVAGGREAVARLALIAVAVGIGVGLLLTTSAGINALDNQNARYAWLETGFAGSDAPAGAEPAGAARVGAGPADAESATGIGPAVGPTAGDPLWWHVRADYFRGERIGRVDVAATGPDSPVPPGITGLPGPGEFYASPELARLLRDTPDTQLGDRFGATLVGTIGDAALPSPTSLLVVVGRSVADLARQAGAVQVTGISTTSPGACIDGCAFGVGIDPDGMTLILSVVVAALLFPVMVFIGSATRLAAARREQRFAAMRLVGATPRQISVLSTVESTVAASAGVGLGFGLFFALRPALAGIPFTGTPFFTEDLSVGVADALLVAFGIPVAAAVAARIALRRVTISPLGVTRRATPRPPSAWRTAPLLAGVGELGFLAYASDIGDSSDTGLQALAYLTGILSIMIGLVVAGPWLTMLGSRLAVRRARRPAALVAGRRLADDPQAGFRAIGGLVLALFVGTCALGVTSGILAHNTGSAPDSAIAAGTVVQRLFDQEFAADPATDLPDEAMAALSVIPGVSGVALIHASSVQGPVVSCAELAAVPALGSCPEAAAGSAVAAVNPDFGGGVVATSTPMSNATWPVVGVSTAGLSQVPLNAIVVGTDATTEAVERARTVLALAIPTTYPSLTLSEWRTDGSRQLDNYRRLADVVIITTLPIAGCSLAVSVVGGLAERRRPFSLLRLTGTPLAVLRRVVLLESALPLLVSAVVSAGAGLLAAHLFLRAQLDATIQPPQAEYYLVVLAGTVASLAVIASTLPLLSRITGPEAARNEQW